MFLYLSVYSFMVHVLSVCSYICLLTYSFICLVYFFHLSIHPLYLFPHLSISLSSYVFHLFTNISSIYLSTRVSISPYSFHYSLFFKCALGVWERERDGERKRRERWNCLRKRERGYGRTGRRRDEQGDRKGKKEKGRKEERAKKTF